MLHILQMLLNDMKDSQTEVHRKRRPVLSRTLHQLRQSLTSMPLLYLVFRFFIYSFIFKIPILTKRYSKKKKSSMTGCSTAGHTSELAV